MAGGAPPCVGCANVLMLDAIFCRKCGLKVNMSVLSNGHEPEVSTMVCDLYIQDIQNINIAIKTCIKR